MRGLTRPSREAATKAEEGVRLRGAKEGLVGEEEEGAFGSASETKVLPSVAEGMGREAERGGGKRDGEEEGREVEGIGTV